MLMEGTTGMNERSRELQERLRARFGQKMAVGQTCSCAHAVAFEEVGEVPNGAEDLVFKVIAELSARGLQVADVHRMNENTVTDSMRKVGAPYLAAGASCTVLASEDKVVVVRSSKTSRTMDDLIALIGEDFDVVIAEAVAFMTIPKILVTKKPQEGFNLGLPNIEAYVSTQDMHNFLPWFDPEDIAGIADFIIERYAKRTPEQIAREAEAVKVAAEAPAVVLRPEVLGAGYLRGELSLGGAAEHGSHSDLLHPVHPRVAEEDQPSASVAKTTEEA